MSDETIGDVAQVTILGKVPFGSETFHVVSDHGSSYSRGLFQQLYVRWRGTGREASSCPDWTARETALMDRHYVYLIACQGDASIYVKIGLTSSIQRRLSNIQTGGPHPITHAFVILSEYREEVKGLEKLLHVLLKPERLRAKSEWYRGTKDFFETLDAALSRINGGGFSDEELLDMPDFVGPEFEIMIHPHEFQFLRIPLPVRKSRDPLEDAQSTCPAEISANIRGRSPIGIATTSETRVNWRSARRIPEEPHEHCRSNPNITKNAI